jgi:hypothetical protein
MYNSSLLRGEISRRVSDWSNPFICTNPECRLEQRQHSTVSMYYGAPCFITCYGCGGNARVEGDWQSHFSMEGRSQPCPVDWMPAADVLVASSRMFKGGVPKKCRHAGCKKVFDEVWLWTKVTPEQAEGKHFKAHKTDYYYRCCGGAGSPAHGSTLHWVNASLLKAAGQRGPL